MDQDGGERAAEEREEVKLGGERSKVTSRRERNERRGSWRMRDPDISRMELGEGGGKLAFEDGERWERGASFIGTRLLRR